MRSSFIASRLFKLTLLESDTPHHPKGPIPRLSISENKTHAIVISMPHEFDIQLVATLEKWKAQVAEFKQTELLEIEIADQLRCIRNLKAAGERSSGQNPIELSLYFSDDADELSYPVALFRQLAVMDPLDIDRFLSYQLNLLQGDKRRTVLFILQLERNVITRLKLFPSMNSKERLKRVLDWSIRVKDRFDQHQNTLYHNWPPQGQQMNANVEAHLLSKLRNRIDENKFKKFAALLKRKNLVEGAPIMTAKDFELFIQFFAPTGNSPLPIKRLSLNLSKSDAAVFFRLMWEEFYERANSEETSRLSIVELFQLAIELFPNVYKGKADSWDRLSRKVLQMAKDYRQNSRMGKTTKNIEAWLDWLEGKRSGNSNKS